MMAIKENEISTAQENVVRYRSKLNAGKSEDNTNQNTVINREEKIDKPSEQKGLTSALPIIDKRRVEAIRRAIETGEYKVDCNRTAEKLLQMEEDIWGDG